jgi:predicted enzyme related to lactoylglutathione lyase
MSKMNPVVHFEMPAEDQKRMSDFYQKAFGWQTKQLGSEMGSYVVVTTTESDDQSGRPKAPGTINGGFYKKTKDSEYPSIVIAVDDIREAMKKIEEAGGKIKGGITGPGEPDDIPGVGLWVSFFDTEGNRVSILQPKGM